MLVLPTGHYLGDAVKKAEMDEAYGRCGEEEKCIQDFDGES